MAFHVGKQSLDFAIRHLISRGDTDIVPTALEYHAIDSKWSEVRKTLLKYDLSKYAVRPARTFLSPKKGLGFRIATQLDPIDCLLITALIYEVGSDLEARRIPRDEGIVHSYRFAPTPDGQLYHSGWTFNTFRSTSLELAESRGGFVLMTDIADFFQRIYFHRLENTLDIAVNSQDHVKAIRRMIKGWNQNVSYGLPVGPSVFRLLAEVTIDDIDQSLLSEGYTFCRFSDDYRIFVSNKHQAMKACAFIAQMLLRNHGLTIQESKTEIVPAEKFIRRFERTEEDAERAHLRDAFHLLVSQLVDNNSLGTEPSEHSDEWDEGGYDDDDTDDDDDDDDAEDDDWDDEWETLDTVTEYAVIEYDDLAEDQRIIIDGLNLWEVLRAQLSSDRALDVSLTAFVLRRIAQLGLQDEDRILLSNLELLYPVFPQVIQVLAVQHPSDREQRQYPGKELLKLFKHPIVGHLPYHRAWILSVFRDASWNHSNKLVRLYEKHSDELTRPALLEAMAGANLSYWFRARKQSVLGLSAWEQRAFLAGARCLPEDEARHWYRSISPQLDFLGQIVADWALDNLI